MPRPRTTTKRLTALILVPVLLLAGIAVFGLVEYRHAVTAEARDVAIQWAKRGDEVFGRFVERAEALPFLVPYREIPPGEESASPDAGKFETAAKEKDAGGLRALLESQGLTAAGLPVRVLAAWRLFDLTGERADAARLAALATHEAPSAISAPVMAKLAERFPGETGWQEEWRLSEAKRVVLKGNWSERGFVEQEDGPGFCASGRALTSEEVRSVAGEIHAGLSVAFPPWMTLDFVALDTSLVSPIRYPYVTDGETLKVVVGIARPDLLYAPYRKLVWWATAVIVCALVTAVTGIVLVTRTMARERRLGELKSQFVASVSHELRAPVASIRLMADALASERVGDATAKDFHRLMSQEGARLSSLIENVLDFARIEEGRKDYAFSETDLSALVADTIAVMMPVARERDIEILNRTEGQVVADVDGIAIQQALINLLDNALKFSPTGSKVVVCLEGEGDVGWRLSVEDEGPGIPRADRTRVFERFTRLGNELRRETKGTGIGLSIVKHIVEAHGGGVAIMDRGEGGGNRMTISCEDKRRSMTVPGVTNPEGGATLQPDPLAGSESENRARSPRRHVP